MKERSAAVAAGVSGIGAVLAYVAATVLGGILRPGYSHISNDISVLTEAGAPHRTLLALLYGAYNILLGIFATALFLSSKRSRLFTVGWALMMLNGASGMLQVTALRRDPDGVPLTRMGIGHIAGASVSSLSTIVGALVVGSVFRRDAYWRPLSSFSLANGVAIILTGLIAAISTVRRSRFMGLFERVTIGLFLLWVLVLSCYALLLKRGAQ